MQRFSYILAFLIVLALLGSTGIRAQSPIPPTEDLVSPRPDKPELPERALEAAREYVEVLQQLQEILQDYVMYIQELDPEARQKLAASLKMFEKGLESGSYSENYGKLVIDLRSYVAELAQAEAEMRAAETEKRRELSQLTRSLKRELSMINQLVEQDVAEKLEECRVHQEAMTHYIETELPVIEIPQYHVATGENGEIIVSSGKGKSYVVVGSDLPDIPEPPELGPLYGPADAPAPRYPGEKGMSRTYSQRLAVTDQSKPIRVNLKAADITVIESRDEAVTATLFVEIAADTREREKAFFNNTSLIIRGDHTGYHVEAELPALKDPKTRLLHSRLKIEMPGRNGLALDNTFGQIDVIGLKSRVEINGHHSQVSVKNVEGEVVVNNMMGPIELFKVKGELEITNSYNLISIVSSEGDMVLENSYGPVKIRNTAGEILLKNSGHVEVRGHSGPLKIDNTNGEVVVLDVEGNVYAFNAYRPVVIRNVEGNVKVENANADITVSDVMGKVKAANRLGQISLTDITGPVDITNENGAIDIYAESGLSGRSFISNSSGEITLSLASRTNLLVEAETLAGQIESTFPMELSDTGERKLAVIRVGEAQNNLDVSTTNSSITIKSAR